MSDQIVQEEPSLGIVDIQNAVKIFDFACEQGAFKGWATIEQVQTVRRKFQAFVDYAAAQQAAADAEAAPAEEAPAE